jgi:L-seryl-tRNA(Ser) seleniumtransferase
MISALSAIEISGNSYQIGNLTLTIGESVSVAGGGSAPESELHSHPIEVTHNVFSATEIELRLRSSARPIISRIENDKVLIDLRTVTSEEEPAIVSSLAVLAQAAD